MDQRLHAVIDVLEHVLDGALVVGPDDRVLHANGDTERIFARERHSLVGLPVGRLLDELPPDWRTPGLHVARARRHDGSAVDVRVAVTAHGASRVLTLQDRANAIPVPSMPDAVVDSTQMLWSIASAVDALMFAGELSPSGWYLPIFQGPGMEALLGAAVPAEDVNRTWDRCVHPEDYPAYERLYDLETRREGEPLEVTYRLRALDGRTRWVRERSVPRRVGERMLLLGVITDVTSEVEDRDALERARAERLAAVTRFERVVELASDLILALDAGGTIRFSNPAAQQLLGLEPERLVGAGWELFVDPDDLAVLQERTAASFGARTVAPAIVRCNAQDGRLLHVSWAGAYNHEDELMFYVGRDVTAEMEARAELERRSRTDALTDLANRRHVVEALLAELERSRRDGRVPGVLMVDLDHFKTVNDHYRHEAGDTVLRAVARRLRRAVRAYDLVGRWGGEEFIVVVPSVASRQALRRVGESVRRAVAASPVPLPDGRRITITASVGGALASEALWSVEAIVDAADRALYAAKRAGRDRVRLVDDVTPAELDVEEPEALRLARALALSASAREGTPEEHVREVAELSAGMAAELGLTEDAVLRCRLGGWLHDIGKIAIPDALLNKPDDLDEEEWRVMRTHAEIGERIVRRIATVAGAAPIVRHHHERMDGTGYPDGLRGEAIPLEARIVAVADAYSALTTERAYRSALESEEALAALAASVGTHLDPRCLGALRRTLAAGGGEAARARLRSA